MLETLNLAISVFFLILQLGALFFYLLALAMVPFIAVGFPVFFFYLNHRNKPNQPTKPNARR